MHMVSSIAPLHFFSQDNENEMQHNYFGHVMLLMLVQCHIMPTMSSMAQIHLLGQEAQKEMNMTFLVM